jgi:hypothetical protein
MYVSDYQIKISLISSVKEGLINLNFCALVLHSLGKEQFIGTLG